MKKSTLLILCLWLPLIAFAQQTGGDYTKWRLSLSGGVAYIASSTSEDENNFVEIGIDRSVAEAFSNNMRWGWQGNADLHYLFHPNWGVGVTYSFFDTSAKLNFTSKPIPVATGYQIIGVQGKEEMNIHYVGPSFIGQRFIDKNNRFRLSALISVGYARFKDKASLLIGQRVFADSNINEFQIHNPHDTSLNGWELHPVGSTVGMYAEIGLEYLLQKNIGVGVDLGYLGASFSKLKDNQTGIKLDLQGKKENISRLDLSLGIRIYW